ncbi:MAG: hypothetical protein ACMUIL_04380 [bacterium]
MTDEQFDRMIGAIELLAKSITEGCKDIKDGLDDVSASILELSDFINIDEPQYND